MSLAEPEDGGVRLARDMRPRHPIRFLVIALLLLLMACDSADGPPNPSAGPHPADLERTSWSVLSAGGLAAVPGSNPTVAFRDGRVGGSGGCNSYGGSYQYDPTSGRVVF